MLAQWKRCLPKPTTILLPVLWGGTLLVTTFVAPLRVSAQTDVATILQNSVEANQRDWEAGPQFAYTEQDLDPKGTRKTYDVTNVLGTPYERLIAINGKPLSTSQEAEQRRQYHEMLSERKSESPTTPFYANSRRHSTSICKVSPSSVATRSIS